MQLDERDRIGGPPPKQGAAGVIIGLILSILVVGGGFYFYRDIGAYLNFGRQSVSNAFNGGGEDNDFSAVYQHLAIKPLDTGIAYQTAVQTQLARLRDAPCDKRGIYQLSVALVQADKVLIAAQALEGFANACKDTEGERYRATDLYFGLGDYDRAIALGDQLVKANPYNGEIQYQRGQASNAKDQWADALPFYINAVELFGDPKTINGTVFFQLANIYAHLDRPCDAITAIQTWVLADPAARETPQARKMIADFSAKGKCDTDSAKGTDEFPRPANGVIVVKAEINKTPGTFIVDTGASFVSLNETYAKRAKVAITNPQAVTLQTANGQITADLGTATTVKLGHAQASNVVIVASDLQLGKGIDGLLGMSFLARFDVSMTDKVLRLKAKNAP